MTEQFLRTEMLLGKEAMDKLAFSRVAVFGIGGVGSFAAEALVRCGVGSIDIIDNDIISTSNINRQIIALHSTIGRPKVEVMKARLLDINPLLNISAYQCFFNSDTAALFNFSEYSYVVDAIDTVTSKILLVMSSNEVGTPIISSMGAGNKLDPTRLEVDDIFNTSVCPLAKAMRHELRKRDIEKLKVVFSKEEPIITKEEDPITHRHLPGSVSFVPSVAGLIIAGEVIRDLTRKATGNNEKM